MRFRLPDQFVWMLRTFGLVMVFEEGPWKAVSLRNVFVLNVLGVWAVFGLITVFSLATLSATDSHVRALFAASLSEMDRARQALSNFEAARHLLSDLQADPTGSDYDHRISELFSRIDAIQKNLAPLEGTDAGPAEPERIEARAHVSAWQALASDLLNDPASLQGETALKLESATRLAAGAVTNALQATSHELTATHTFGLRRFELARRDILLFSVGIAVVYLLFAFAKMRWIQRPIESAIELAEHIAGGHFATRVKSTRVKEVSRLIEALEKMQHNLRRAATADKELIRLQSLRTEQAISGLPVGLSMFDKDSRLVLCNEVYRQIYGLSEAVTRPGTHFTEIIEAYCARSEKAREENHSNFYERLKGRVPFTETSVLQDGRYIRMHVRPLPDGGWIDVQEDITEEKKREEAFAYMARHDSLTGLPNRFMLLEHLDNALKTSRADGDTNIALHCIDLQRFTEINDTLGHPVGDALLKAAATRLSSAVRDTDLVARIGGDEFVIVQQSPRPLDDAATLATRIISVMGTAFDVEGHRLFTGASVGIAVGKSDMSPDHLLAQADLALYRAKDDGDSIYCFYAEDMNREAHARRELEQELRDALTNGEFEVYYQPIVSTESRHVKGAEALLRWRNPKRGLISPQLFVPIAEDQGLIVPMGDWILKEACREATRWPDDTKISINISPVQFKSGTLVESVVLALASSGLPARRLILEITETVLVQDAELVVTTVERLRALGVQIAMDDFGTGYSSLNYLRLFHFDKIKIDRSFIMDLTSGADSANAIMRAMVEIGKALKLEITAEGVETEELFKIVREVGCTEVQGFLIGKPMPRAAIRRFMGLEPDEADELAVVAGAPIISLEQVKAGVDRQGRATPQADQPIILDLSETAAIAS